jgi:predicted RNase H-like nuclease
VTAAVGGLDGCRGGWVLATLLTELEESSLRIDVVPNFASALALVSCGALSALAVDMPIGLPDGPRAADTEARRRLGSRRSTVFPTPVRATMGAADYQDALTRSRGVCGKGLSAQAFNLLPRIVEVDEAMTPELQDRVFECHPELAFAHLAGAVVTSSKHTATGIDERVELLVGALGPDADVDPIVRHPPRGASSDDVADAVAIALVARRWLTGDVERLGDGARDARGLRMEIVV